jgi:aminomethyltransferase
MGSTALYESPIATGLRAQEYRGAQTAAVYSDVSNEFAALRNGAAVADFGWRAKLVATGKDRVRWLNGMVTNNIRDLPIGRGVYSFVLNPQGRIQGDLYAFNRGEYLLIETDRAQLETLKTLLQRYIIMDDVQLTEMGDKLTSIALLGPRSDEALKTSGVFAGELQPLEVQDVVWQGFGLSVVRLDEREPAYEFWIPPANAKRLWDALAAAGATPAGAEALETWRIWSGRPRYGADIRDRDLPQETAQEQALHYKKGCYIGQEIVERIHSRGNVHRGLTGFVFDGEPAAPGTKIELNGRDMGEITSVTKLPGSNGRAIGIGYLRREAGGPGTVLEFGGVKATVAALPFDL